MNIRDLKYLVAIAEENHFGRAAEKCHVSQPALSSQIAKLEIFLGVSLFERTNRSVRITPVGSLIVSQARQLLAISDDIISIARNATDPLSGPFRLGMIKTVGPYLSPLIVNSLREEIPNITLTLIEGLTSDLEERILNGDLDAAITATAPKNTQFSQFELYEEPFWVALYKAHPLAKPDSIIDYASLTNEKLLLLADGHCLRDQALEVCHITNETSDVNTQETSLETLIALVAMGNGITLVPALAAPQNLAKMKNLIMRKEVVHGAGRTVRLIYRTTFPKAELIKVFADVIRSNVPQEVVKAL